MSFPAMSFPVTDRSLQCLVWHPMNGSLMDAIRLTNYLVERNGYNRST